MKALKRHATLMGVSAFVGVVVCAMVASAGFAQITVNRNLTDISPATLGLVEDAPEQAQFGARLFDFHCSACHGDTGLGLEEGRASFPAGKRDCAECHHPKNPAQMDPQLTRPNFAFSVGDPPALRDDNALKNFTTAGALQAYVQATMPRPFPGQLPGEEVWAITAFLLHVNGVDLGPEPIEASPELPLREGP